MRNRFDAQLALLQKDLIEMGALCEQELTRCVRVLKTGDAGLAEEVRTVGSEIDRMEHSIESACLKLLLQQQPVASDLRQVSAALKMITDLERIGDQAEDIAELGVLLKGRAAETCPVLVEMAAQAGKMVTDSIDAFVRRDLSLAAAVIAADDAVDAAFLRAKEQLLSRITKQPTDAGFALDVLMTAKYLERIGDHATNLAEWVEFSVTGVHKGETEL